MDSFCSMGIVSVLLDGKSLRPVNVNMVNNTELLKNDQDGKCLLVFTLKI